MNPASALNFMATSSLLFLDQAAAQMGIHLRGSGLSLSVEVQPDNSLMNLTMAEHFELKNRGALKPTKAAWEQDTFGLVADSGVDLQSVYAMVKIENAGLQFNYALNSAWQSEGAYCASDNGQNGQLCKSILSPGQLQTTDFENSWDSATYTYLINNNYYNIKVGPEASGLLDENGNIVASYQGCTGTNSFPSGYTLVSIDCDVAETPNYVVQTYSLGVPNRGVDANGQQWASGTYYLTDSPYDGMNSLNEMKSWGTNYVRYSFSAIKIQGQPFAVIDYTTEGSVGYQVMQDVWQIKTAGMGIIFDMHDDPCGEYFESQGSCKWDPDNGVFQITSSQLENFWSQTSNYFQTLGAEFNQWLDIGIANEPHEMSSDPNNQSLEANATYSYLQPSLVVFSTFGMINNIYVEPSQWGGIFEFANQEWQQWFENMRANFPGLKLIADGHAYGTATDGPGGTGYGDCDPDGVSHNYLEPVAQWAQAKNITLAMTETNGDPNYANCISFVQTTLAFTNQYARNEKGGFQIVIVWAYALHLDQYDPQVLDLNGAGSAMVPAIQEIDYWVPAELAGDPSMAPTTAPPTGQPSGRPTSRPSNRPTGQPTSPTGQPTSNPTAPTNQPTEEDKPHGDSAENGFIKFAKTNIGKWTLGSLGAITFLGVCGYVSVKARESLENEAENRGAYQILPETA